MRSTDTHTTMPINPLPPLAIVEIPADVLGLLLGVVEL
jgi:hypothetical protein